MLFGLLAALATVSQTAGSTSTIRVGLFGELSSPGVYQLDEANPSLADLLKKRNVWLAPQNVLVCKRDNRVLVTSATEDAKLEDGDLVYVPPMNDAVIVDEGCAYYVMFERGVANRWTVAADGTIKAGEASTDGPLRLGDVLARVSKATPEADVKYLVIPNALERIQIPDQRDPKGLNPGRLPLSPGLYGKNTPPIVLGGGAPIGPGDIVVTSRSECFEPLAAKYRARFKMPDVSTSRPPSTTPSAVELALGGWEAQEESKPTDAYRRLSLAFGPFFLKTGAHPYPDARLDLTPKKVTDAAGGVQLVDEFEQHSVLAEPAWKKYDELPLSKPGAEAGRLHRNYIVLFDPKPATAYDLLLGKDYDQVKAGIAPAVFARLRVVYSRFRLLKTQVFVYDAPVSSATKGDVARAAIRLTSLGLDKDPDPLGANRARYLAFPSLFASRTDAFAKIPGRNPGEPDLYSIQVNALPIDYDGSSFLEHGSDTKFDLSKSHDTNALVIRISTPKD